MIFAALALRCEDAAARLDRVRRRWGGGVEPRVVRSGNACLAVWPSEEDAVLDEGVRRATSGPFEGDLSQGRACGRFAAIQLCEAELVLARADWRPLVVLGARRGGGPGLYALAPSG
jgi:hypothetical protein